MKLVDLEGSICAVVYLNSIVLYPCSGLYFMCQPGIYCGFSFFFLFSKVSSEGDRAHSYWYFRQMNQMTVLRFALNKAGISKAYRRQKARQLAVLMQTACSG